MRGGCEASSLPESTLNPKQQEAAAARQPLSFHGEIGILWCWCEYRRRRRARDASARDLLMRRKTLGQAQDDNEGWDCALEEEDGEQAQEGRRLLDDEETRGAGSIQILLWQ